MSRKRGFVYYGGLLFFVRVFVGYLEFLFFSGFRVLSIVVEAFCCFEF